MEPDKAHASLDSRFLAGAFAIPARGKKARWIDVPQASCRSYLLGQQRVSNVECEMELVAVSVGMVLL